MLHRIRAVLRAALGRSAGKWERRRIATTSQPRNWRSNYNRWRPATFVTGPSWNRTGLTGTCDLHLQWMMQQQLDAGMSGPTMFAAVEKLGLTLEKKRESAEMLIVDHCEQTQA